MRRAHPALKETSATAAALPEKFCAVNVMSREQCNHHVTCVQNKYFQSGGKSVIGVGGIYRSILKAWKVHEKPVGWLVCRLVAGFKSCSALKQL